MGDRRKQMKIQDEIEGMDRRKSSRIIALEEKKQQERERKLAMAAEKKNNSVNSDIKNKGKGKATMEVGYDLMSDFNEAEEGPISKKELKNKELYQLFSSIKEIGRHSENTSALKTNDSSLSGLPLKNSLEIIIDFLQRKDVDELFAEPVPNVEEIYHKAVKQPMDFATMRAKLYEDMYSDLGYFKRDVFLICSNAMNVNPPSSKYHQVAEDISKNAKWIFEALSAGPQHIDLENFQNKRLQGKKPKNVQLRTSQRVSSKPTVRKNATGTERRDTYCPPSKPLVAEVFCGNKPNIQLNENPIKYRESLLRFVKDLGPTAKRVAEKKLQALQNQQQQRCNGDTPSQNVMENASGTQIIHQQQTPQIPAQPQPQPQPDLFNAQTLALALPLLSRQLRNPGFAASVDRFLNTNAGNANANANVSSRNVFSIVHPTRVISGPQLRPAGTVSLSDQSLMPQTRRRYSMYDMPSSMLTVNSLVHQNQPWPPEFTSSLNPLRQRESMPGTSYHHARSFQSMLDAEYLNNYTSPPNATQGFPPEMQMQAMNKMKPHGDGEAVPLPPQEPNNASSSSQQINHCGEEGQTEEAPPQLPLWEDNQQPNLELGL